VTGYFDRRTQREVRSYQRGRGLSRTGVVSVETWDALQQGRR
jgi:peptidoglycan hydrolase-like protein with peptidoglycan-binding domain